MGIAYAHLKYLEMMTTKMETPLEILFLGRQDCTDRTKRASELIERHLISVNKEAPIRGNDYFADTFMLDSEWASIADSMDISNYEGANLIYDLNNPIDLGRTYDLVIDGGTLEHIFNVPIALENISSLLKVGGKIIHFSPANNHMGHGFYQFSPELFASFYSTNNGYTDTQIFLYDPTKKKKLFKVKVQNLSSRIEIMKSGRLQIWCESTKVQNRPVKQIQQTDYVVQWEEFDIEDSVKTTSVLKYGRAHRFIELLKSNRLSYFLALNLYNRYRKFYWHSVSGRNPDLTVIPWK